MTQTEQRQITLTTGMVLLAMQRLLQEINEKESDFIPEPFPVEISELFLYSPDGENVYLVFSFLGQDFVLSEDSISVESEGEILIINDPLRTKILEFLALRMKLLRDLEL